MRRLPLRSPPRVRGKVHPAHHAEQGDGITPAYAGKSRCNLPSTAPWKDHPRVCGEKPRIFFMSIRSAGSPPRMRGKGQPLYIVVSESGITPACAGKSLVRELLLIVSRDHPRVCGEKPMPHSFVNHSTGSPPRMRGKAEDTRSAGRTAGITPACAGKRRPVPSPRSTRQDHPRVCGEKPPKGCGLNLILGSPPRVRGKAAAARAGLVAVGITPACAGKSAARTD